MGAILLFEIGAVQLCEIDAALFYQMGAGQLSFMGAIQLYEMGAVQFCEIDAVLLYQVGAVHL